MTAEPQPKRSGRPPNPNSLRQRAIAAGLSLNTLAKRRMHSKTTDAAESLQPSRRQVAHAYEAHKARMSNPEYAATIYRWLADNPNIR